MRRVDTGGSGRNSSGARQRTRRREARDEIMARSRP